MQMGEGVGRITITSAELLRKLRHFLPFLNLLAAPTGQTCQILLAVAVRAVTESFSFC